MPKLNRNSKKDIPNKYKSLDDQFVDKYLRKDGETIEQAKKRLKQEQKQLEKEKQKKLNDKKGR